MPDFGVNLSRFNPKSPKNSKKINKNPSDLKLIFLELAHLGLYTGKVWENRFFSILHDLVGPYRKLLLNPGDQVQASNANHISGSGYSIVIKGVLIQLIPLRDKH